MPRIVVTKWFNACYIRHYSTIRDFRTVHLFGISEQLVHQINTIAASVSIYCITVHKLLISLCVITHNNNFSLEPISRAFFSTYPPKTTKSWCQTTIIGVNLYVRAIIVPLPNRYKRNPCSEPIFQHMGFCKPGSVGLGVCISHANFFAPPSYIVSIHLSYQHVVDKF